MFIPSRNVWHPLGRKPAAVTAPSEPPNQAEPANIDQDQEELEGVELDEEQFLEEEEDAELSDADFYRQLRQDVEGVREGTVPSIADTEHKVRQMRPWSKKRHRRDRYGNRLY